MNETLGITATEESQKRPNRATGRRGRKPTAQSHAAEIRGKLAAWKQTPESVRPSLRVLARQIGTSHQLLSHYLQGWDKWQAKQYQYRAKEIRARAEAETRPFVKDELSKQAEAYDWAAFQCMIS